MRVVFVGGPLDGREIEARGRLSCYRDPQGNPLSTQRGDRLLGSAGMRRPKLAGVYAIQTTGYGQRSYVWRWATPLKK